MGQARAGATLAYVGIGANLGEPRAMVHRACEALAGLESTLSLRRSGLYRSAPVEATGPDFVNAVVALETTLEASELHQALHQLENDFGRVRGERKVPTGTFVLMGQQLFRLEYK